MFVCFRVIIFFLALGALAACDRLPPVFPQEDDRQPRHRQLSVPKAIDILTGAEETRREQDMETPPLTNPNCPSLRYLPEHLVYQQQPRIFFWAPRVFIYGEENERNEKAVVYASLERRLRPGLPEWKLLVDLPGDQQIFLGMARKSLVPSPFQSFTILDCERLPFIRIEEDPVISFFQSRGHKSEGEHGAKTAPPYKEWKILSLDSQPPVEIGKIRTRNTIEGFEVIVNDESGIIASFFNWNRSPPPFGLRWVEEVKRPNALDPVLLLMLPVLMDPLAY